MSYLSIRNLHKSYGPLEVLKGVGHMAVQEAPLETARIVRAYLDAELAPAPSAPAEEQADAQATVAPVRS